MVQHVRDAYWKTNVLISAITIKKTASSFISVLNRVKMFSKGLHDVQNEGVNCFKYFL